MREYLGNAKGEMVRADHLIYVSLKYTRTVDVIKSVVERLINAFDFVILGLLEEAKENGKIDDIPAAPVKKCELLTEKVYKGNEEMYDYLQFYLLLRRISKAEFSRDREYRRHVTMTALIEGMYIELTIDIITEYYHRAHQFLEFIESSILK